MVPMKLLTTVIKGLDQVDGIDGRSQNNGKKEIHYFQLWFNVGIAPI